MIFVDASFDYGAGVGSFHLMMGMGFFFRAVRDGGDTLVPSGAAVRDECVTNTRGALRLGGGVLDEPVNEDVSDSEPVPEPLYCRLFPDARDNFVFPEIGTRLSVWKGGLSDC